MRLVNISTATKVALLLAMAFCQVLLVSAAAQPVGSKSLDEHSDYVGAVILRDVRGRYLINASCVALHPKVVLTVAHAEPAFAARTYLAGHDASVDLELSFDSNFRSDKHRYSVSADQVVPIPSFGKGNRDEDERDLALIFLDQPLPMQWFPQLPASGLATRLKPGARVRVTGYGLHKPTPAGLPFIPLPSDGYRRNFEGRLARITNEGWFEIEGQARTGDSGSPVVLVQGQKRVILGLVSQAGTQHKSWITRLDSPWVLDWIRRTARANAGVRL